MNRSFTQSPVELQGVELLRRGRFTATSLDQILFSDYIAGVESTEQFELVQLANGSRTIRSNRAGETFHPVIGPENEAKALYIDQLNLVERMQSTEEEFVIWDVGLGGGANALTVLKHSREVSCPLRLISFDCSLEPLQFAAEHAKELGYFGRYDEPVGQILSSSEAVFQNERQSVHWEFHLGDFPNWLRTGAPGDVPAPHVVLYDAYSPARNPEMWTLEVFSNLYGRLSPERPCQLPTYSRSTLLRVTLLLAGFYVGAGHATGEKEETTIACNTAGFVDEPLGYKWLERVKKSTSAEPLREPIYRQCPLSAESFIDLMKRPQFASQTEL